MNAMRPYPRGWFVIAWAGELAPGSLKPMRYFGRDLVLWRKEDGTPVVQDAFCPHLGAHFAHGGHVKGDRLVCPFHAWEFDDSGACAHIPYATKIPPRARIACWPVVERNGVIFMWHDPDGGAPDWEIPVIAEHGTSDWTPWYENKVTVNTHPREIVENVADSAHFPAVHRTFVDQFENIYEGHKATQHTIGKATPKLGGVDHFDITATYHGPAFQISDMRGVLHAMLLLAHTPIDENSLDLRFAVMLQRTGPRTEEFAKFYVDNLTLGFHEDIAIWEHKVYRPRPQLVAEDGPIGRLRAWYSQFYRSADVVGS